MLLFKYIATYTRNSLGQQSLGQCDYQYNHTWRAYINHKLWFNRNILKINYYSMYMLQRTSPVSLWGASRQLKAEVTSWTELVLLCSKNLHCILSGFIIPPFTGLKHPLMQIIWHGNKGVICITKWALSRWS